MIHTLAELSTVVTQLVKDSTAVIDGEEVDLAEYSTVRILNAVREYLDNGGKL